MQLILAVQHWVLPLGWQYQYFTLMMVVIQLKLFTKMLLKMLKNIINAQIAIVAMSGTLNKNNLHVTTYHTRLANLHN